MSGDDEVPGQHGDWHRYERWDWDDHDDNRGGDEAHDVLAEMEKVRRFLRELYTEPKPTRAHSPMPFTNGFFVPDSTERAVPRDMRANRAPRPTVEDAVDITQIEGVPNSASSQESRPPAELAALNTYRRRSSNNPIGNKDKDKEGEKECECHYSYEGTRGQHSPGTPTTDPTFPFTGFPDPDQEEGDMVKAKRKLYEEERMMRDYEDIYKEFVAERNQRLVDKTQQVHDFPHLRGGRGTPEPDEVARQRADTLATLEVDRPPSPVS
jgi:hypothetical protein